MGCNAGSTYTEVLDVGKDLVIQGEVVGGDDVNASILLDLPVSKSQPLGLSEELLLRNLAAPVCWSSQYRTQCDAVKIKWSRCGGKKVLGLTHSLP